VLEGILRRHDIQHRYNVAGLVEEAAGEMRVLQVAAAVENRQRNIAALPRLDLAKTHLAQRPPQVAGEFALIDRPDELLRRRRFAHGDDGVNLAVLFQLLLFEALPAVID
jgi:hypothetical protein